MVEEPSVAISCEGGSRSRFRSMGRVLWPCVGLLGIVTMGRPAFAGDAALAESLFRQGRALLNKGKYAEACPKLKESFDQDPATGTLVALAVCQEGLGQTASAWASYAEVVSRAKHEGREDRMRVAREKVQSLAPKLSRLTIDVDTAMSALPDLVVKRDGVILGKAAWSDPAPVDPGDHVIEATAPGKRPWSTTVTIGAAADSKTVKVVLEDSSSSQTADAGKGSVAMEATSASNLPSTKLIAISLAGAGVLALGASTYFALHASSLNSDSKSDGHCDANNACDATGFGKRNDAVTASTDATIALVAGGLLTGAGATLFFLSHDKTRSDSAAIELTPSIGPGRATMLVRGSF
jgi:hypothetical protein